MLETYFSTARSVITSLSAMPWFEFPCAIRSSTSRSRGVSRSSGSSFRRRERSVDTMIGSIAEPPSATRRTAATKSLTSLIRSFNRYPTPSAESASSFIASPTSTYCDSTSTPVAGYVARISSAARSPSSLCVGGRRMSTIAISTGWLRRADSNSSAVPHSATTSSPASRSSRATPSRSSRLSSAIATRTEPPPSRAYHPRAVSRPEAARRAPRRDRRGHATLSRARYRLRRSRHRRSPRPSARPHDRHRRSRAWPGHASRCSSGSPRRRSRRQLRAAVAGVRRAPP